MHPSGGAGRRLVQFNLNSIPMQRNKALASFLCPSWNVFLLLFFIFFLQNGHPSTPYLSPPVWNDLYGGSLVRLPPASSRCLVLTCQPAPLLQPSTVGFCLFPSNQLNRSLCKFLIVSLFDSGFPAPACLFSVLFLLSEGSVLSAVCYLQCAAVPGFAFKRLFTPNSDR